MDRKLDLSGVRIYSNTKDDILDAMDLIDEEVYMSNFSDFNTYDICNLAGVVGIKHIASDSRHFLAEGDNGLGFREYRFFILAKDAKFKDEKTYKIFRPYESIDEFCIETGCVKVGTDLLTIRNKRRKQKCVLLYTGYSEDAVHLGSYVLTFEALVKHYEFYNKCGEWKPFGIEE